MKKHSIKSYQKNNFLKQKDQNPSNTKRLIQPQNVEQTKIHF